MSETPSTTVPRVFWKRDYRRFADALRRARKNKTLDQLSLVDATTMALTAMLSQDSTEFDGTRFLKSCRLRLETTDYAKYQAWAAKKGYDAENPEAACEHYKEYYTTRGYATFDTYDDPADEDDEDDLEDEDEEDEDEEDDPEPESGQLV